MATTPNDDIGLNLMAQNELPKYEAEANLYVVHAGQDWRIKFSTLMTYLVEQAAELQIPEDVVRTEQMNAAISKAIGEITFPDPGVPEIDLNELFNKLMATEQMQGFQEELKDLLDKAAAIEEIDLTEFLKKSDFPVGKPFQMNEAGQLIASNFGSSRLLYVVGRASVDGEPELDGSLAAPFRTIQQAVDKSSGSNSVIVVMPSNNSSDYAGFTVDSLTNTTVMGYGLRDAHMVRIVGTVVNKGSGTRFRLKDVQLAASGSTPLVYHSKGTEGRDYFENVTIEKGSTTGTHVLLEDVKNWIDFHNCNINGEVSISGTAGANALVAMKGGNATGTHITLDSDVKLLINDATRFGSVKQLQGKLEVNFSHTFAGKNGVAIDSQGGTMKLAFSDFSGKKVVRGAALDPVELFNTLAEVEGPFLDHSFENVYTAVAPSFTFGSEGASPSKTGKIYRLATRGYYYEQLKGSIVQVAVGEKPHAEGAVVTEFDLSYGDTALDVPFQHDPLKPEVYLVLTDPANGDRAFVFGPYAN